EANEEYAKSSKLSGDLRDLFAPIEMSHFIVLRGLLGGYQDPKQAIEGERQAIEFLQRIPVTARVTAYRAMSYLIVLFAQKKIGNQKLDWASFDESLQTLTTEPYLSTREYEYLTMMGRTLHVMGEDVRALSVLEELVRRIEYVRSLLTDPRLQ